VGVFGEYLSDMLRDLRIDLERVLDEDEIRASRFAVTDAIAEWTSNLRTP